MNKKKIITIYVVFSFVWLYVLDYVLQFYHLNGSYIPWMRHVQVISYIMLTCFFIYYLLSKRDELEQVKQEEKKLSTLINSMVDFVNFKDGEGRWIQANDFGLKLFQIEDVDYRGKKDSELAEYSPFYSEALRYCEVSDEETWQAGEMTRCEEVVPLPQGGVKVFDTIKVPLFYEDGTRRGLVIIGRDITKIKEAEERLRRTEKLSVVGELAASVAHEIRNPLTSLKGFVQLLQAEDSVHEQYYTIMLSELERVNHIVGELLVLAKPQKLSFQRENLALIIEDVAALLESQANLHCAHVEVNIEEGLPHIECESNQLKQVFINLIQNAMEALSTKVEIVLKTYDDNHVLIQVQDNGCGIPEERMKHLGEPFFSYKEKGTGLGLTVSNRIVESHHGKIKFRSEVNTGTTVDIILPIHISRTVQKYVI